MDSKELQNKLENIESRLLNIENHLNIPKPQAASAANPTPWEIQATSLPKSPAPFTQPIKPGQWLGIVGVICFILAAGFIIKLSIESGWLTPVRQIAIAALFGFSLIGAGFALMKSDREYASLLPGTGIIVLYLTVFAAHRYYQLIPLETALALVGIISLLCIWLYSTLKHDIYAITAATGAYLSPVILGLHAEAEFSLYYFLLCSVTFACISVGVRSRILTLVSSYLAILMTAWVGLSLMQDMLVAIILPLHFVIFSLGTYLHSIQSRMPLSEREANSVLPVLLMFYAMEYHFLERLQPGLAPWISLGFAGFLIALYAGARKYFEGNLGSQKLVIAFATLVSFHSGYMELLPEHMKPWLLVSILFGWALLCPKPEATGNNRTFALPLFALLVICAIEYVSIVFDLLENDASSNVGVAIAAFLGIWAVIIKVRNPLAAFGKSDSALLIAAHLLAITGLLKLTHEISSLAVSASWLFYGVAVITFAFARKDETMAKSALFVLAFAAGKALLFDAASAPTILRILCLLLTGAVLYGCGLLMRRIASWRHE